jgi:clan AA aspartic protease
MGFVYEEITLKNAGDESIAARGIIEERDVRQTTVTALVDTGALTMIINENLRLKLGLGVQGEHYATLADEGKVLVKTVEPVRICWKNRSMVCEPWVIPGDGDILLGAIPLENMDLIVDPARRVLTGAHGDEPVGIIK